jgi:hypothetical protein
MMRITKRQLRRVIKEQMQSWEERQAEMKAWEKKLERVLMDDLDTVAEFYLDEFGDDADTFMDDDRDTLKKLGLSWDEADDVYDLILSKLAEKSRASTASSPNVKELNAIAGGMGSVEDRELPYITYQPRRKGGKIIAIMVEDSETPWGTQPFGRAAFMIDEQDASQAGTTLDKVMSVLEKGGAKLRKKRKPVKWNLPYYD